MSAVTDSGDATQVGQKSGDAPREHATRPAVIFDVSPPSRLWEASCIGLSTAFLFIAAFRSLSALLSTLGHPTLEAYFLP